MKDVTADLLRTEDYRGEKKLNSFSRKDLLLNRLTKIARGLDWSRTVTTVVMEDGVCVQEQRGGMDIVRHLVEVNSETHVLELYINRNENQVVIRLGKKIGDPQAETGEMYVSDTQDPSDYQEDESEDDGIDRSEQWSEQQAEQ